MPITFQRITPTNTPNFYLIENLREWTHLGETIFHHNRVITTNITFYNLYLNFHNLSFLLPRGNKGKLAGLIGCRLALVLCGKTHLWHMLSRHDRRRRNNFTVGDDFCWLSSFGDRVINVITTVRTRRLMYDLNLSCCAIAKAIFVIITTTIVSVINLNPGINVSKRVCVFGVCNQVGIVGSRLDGLAVIDKLSRIGMWSRRRLRRIWNATNLLPREILSMFEFAWLCGKLKI